MGEPDFRYVGDELELFARAANWKRYLRDQIGPHLRGDVLEVGAGLGSTTRALRGAGEATWTCLEPDADLAAKTREATRDLDVTVRVGTTASLGAGAAFDAVLYVDVLEHIEDDCAEAARAWRLLRRGGRLVVLAPAHRFLFSPMDEAVGHFRRYDRRSLARVAPAGARVVVMRYLDAVGFFASLGNRALLRAAVPTQGQIALWDGVMVRASRVVDSLLAYRFGKSVLAVWEKNGQERTSERGGTRG